MLLISTLLALLSATVGGLVWIRARRDRDDVLPDAGVSTLVFPPESKFQPSELPRSGS
ncbi:hypothetical protein ACPWT1_22595 [Ramlibacter sp. MMS24-I3-19]|uniref:hypothetical protein n=1 Tax=Ramlibacter sp. MMS24-I3-19 TaxID=3416606 RepID=UPI003CFC76F9